MSKRREPGGYILGRRPKHRRGVDRDQQVLPSRGSWKLSRGRDTILTERGGRIEKASSGVGRQVQNRRGLPDREDLRPNLQHLDGQQRLGGAPRPATEVVMNRRLGRRMAVVFAAVMLGWMVASVPVVGQHLAAGAAWAADSGQEGAVFAGGCFWGVQAVFQRVKGVRRAVSGYAGGSASSARYDVVSGGTTGHAESVQVTFDPTQISYAELLKVFFLVAHDPTQLNRQGPDVGTQYRSSIFYMNEAQARVAREVIAQLAAAKAFPRPIVTQVVPLNGFYPAEAYHQDYLDQHPNEPYIVVNDWPKIDSLRKHFPNLFVAK
jgi:peptide-methionine (S)-S-oxide reductase